MTRRTVLISALAVGVVLLAAGLVWFTPWRLFTDKTVNDAAPAGLSAAATPSSAPSQATAPATTPSAQKPQPPAGPMVLASGRLISHEHETTGTVRVVRLANGSRIVRIEDLSTSNGPDLRVWLTDAKVTPDGWHVFDDGRYVSLGKLKGNRGSQNYPVPADLQLSAYTSLTIWCDRFDVSFGAAALA